MTYVDIEIEKCLQNIKYQFQNKKVKWDKIRIYLYKLSQLVFEQGVYVGK